MSDRIAIAGVVPRDLVTPRDTAELAATVRVLHAQRRAFAFVGGGTELELGNAPRALDTVVRTTSLDRVIDYTPEDQTITLEAGITFASLDRLLAENRQMLPIDVGDRERSTVGGAVATNASGRRRLRYGTIKDLIVGVTIVRADGVVVRGGGKVVKNVAGFDLPKLMVGSLGTLGGIAAVTLRVYPVAEASRTLALGPLADGAEATALWRAFVAAQLEPESVAVYDGTTMVVTFAGTRGGVDAQFVTARETAARRGVAGHEASVEELARYEQTERDVRTGGAWRTRTTAPPEQPARAAASVTGAEYRGVAGRVWYPPIGLALDAFDGDASAIADLRENVAVATLGAGAVVVHAMPLAARASVDAWPPATPSLPLMRVMKQNFDPHALCNPGRFVGGI